MFKNIPEIKLGVVAVSRDCFPAALSVRRREALIRACLEKKLPVAEMKTTVESETGALEALGELEKSGCNALLVYLGNFGPEGPETMLAQRFRGPVMFYAAAEEDMEDLYDGRGDAYCGMLNAGYNLRLRGVRAYIPEYPVGSAPDAAREIDAFLPVARAVLGLSDLKIFSFGPRPYDFLACNAPIKPLFDLGINIQENSELDLLVAYRKHVGDKRIGSVAADMRKELGAGDAGFLERLAQYELTLLDWMEENLGAAKYGVFANKCWPAFQTEFRFCPCYVNSRLTSRLIPVSCETDIYGALSEYLISCVTLTPPTLLDINNTVPENLYKSEIKERFDYAPQDLFMGFHCGNTPSCHLKNPALKYQFIMKRALEPEEEPDITRGTLEGDIRPGPVTLFRLQSTPGCRLQGYVAEGDILPVSPRSFGGIGIFAIPGMGRFYRHVLIEKGYPHHGGVAFRRAGRALFETLKYLGVGDIGFNRPEGMPYPMENPFK